MRVHRLICAAIAAALIPAAALADDPFDPAMQSSAARARDHEMIRQLNLQELARVRERDAGYAAGWRAYASNRSADDESQYSARSRTYDRDRDDFDQQQADYARQHGDYDRARARYEQQMAEWRDAVAACRGGDWSACDN